MSISRLFVFPFPSDKFEIPLLHSYKGPPPSIYNCSIILHHTPAPPPPGCKAQPKF